MLFRSLAVSVFVCVLGFSSFAFGQDASAPPPPPPPNNLGGAGESCRARADCKNGLKCVNLLCTDEHEGQTCGATSDCGGELRCIGGKCTTTIGASHGGGGGGAGSDEWMSFKLDDGQPHPFIALTILGGPVLGGVGANGQFQTGNTDGAFLLGVRGGVVIGPNELSLELSPMTYFWDLASGNPGPTFQFNVAYRYLIKLYEAQGLQVFYPIGLGLGLFTGNTNGDVFFQARFDLIGILVKYGHLLVDINLPSFRYGVTSQGVLGETFNLDTFTWLFGASIGYAF